MVQELLRLTQHIRYWLMSLPFRTLPPLVATAYMLETLYAKTFGARLLHTQYTVTHNEVVLLCRAAT